MGRDSARRGVFSIGCEAWSECSVSLLRWMTNVCVVRACEACADQGLFSTFQYTKTSATPPRRSPSVAAAAGRQPHRDWRGSSQAGFGPRGGRGLGPLEVRPPPDPTMVHHTRHLASSALGSAELTPQINSYSPGITRHLPTSSNNAIDSEVRLRRTCRSLSPGWSSTREKATRRFSRRICFMIGSRA